MERIVEKVSFSKIQIPKRKQVAVYARVSSGKEAMLHSLAAQVSHYKEVIADNPTWQFCGIYADEAISGTKSNRQQFERMITDCKAGKIDLIITKSISRFARNTVTLLQIVRELKELKIDVYFEEQNLHTLSSDGELVLSFLAGFAQEEARSVSENMKWRVQRKFEKGLPWDPTILGYRMINGEYQIHPEEAKTVQLIYGYYLSGMGTGEIAKKLNEQNIKSRFGKAWCDTSVRAVLKNQTYTGTIILQKTFRENFITKRKLPNQGEFPMVLVEDAHEAIISQETFNAVQALMQKKEQKYYHPVPQNCSPFDNKIICGLCGKPFRRKTTHSIPKWYCSTYSRNGKEACPSKVIREDTLEEKTNGLNFASIMIFPNTLTILLHDGSTVQTEWTNPSRSKSWTTEMKEKAREREMQRWNGK